MMTTKLREPANGLTHLAGVFLSIAALVALVWIGVTSGNVLVLIGLCIFGVSQLALYTASTLHHSLRLSPPAEARLLRFDVMMVFVFIAGTYTPLCLIALHHVWRWGLLGLVWALVLGGLLFTTRWMHAPRWLSTAYYVLIGWVGLAAAPVLFHALPPAGVRWMLAGGIVYTVGALIFIIERPRLFPGVFDSHALWHLFVLGGSFCCFWLIVRYVVPLG
ncbi:MAG: PAQR family membrane homeostasis protein TrhA [Thermomicrobiales bacterium]